MRSFQHIGKKRRIFHILLNIFHLFCDTFPYQKTPILFILISTITIDGRILRFLLRIKSIHSNQKLTPLNHFMMLLCYHMEYIDLGYLFKRKKQMIEKFFCPWRLTKRSLLDRAINNTTYLFLNRYRHIFPYRWNGIII